MQGEFNLNLVQWYVVYNIGFIAVAFLWICFGHMFKSHQEGGEKHLNKSWGLILILINIL